MKILFVFNHPAPYKVKLFNYLSKYMDLDVIFERKSAQDRPYEFYKDNVYDFNCNFLKSGCLGRENSYTFELANYIKNNFKNYDLIIMNGYSTFTEMLAINYMIKAKIPYFLYINGGVIKKDTSIKKKLKTYFISHAEGYFSPSKEADNYLSYYGATKHIYRYTYSTIELKDILLKPLSLEDKQARRKDFNLPLGPLFVTASQFIERKNILYLLEIFKDRKENLLLIGDGPEKDTYIDFIKQNRINNVLILPYMEKNKLFELLRICDCFITLSKEDIYGHTINEAFACGLPVISSNNVLSAEKLIVPGKNGYIVDLNQDINIELSNALKINPLECIETAKNNTMEISVNNHIAILKEIIR